MASLAQRAPWLTSDQVDRLTGTLSSTYCVDAVVDANQTRRKIEAQRESGMLGGALGSALEGNRNFYDLERAVRTAEYELGRQTDLQQPAELDSAKEALAQTCRHPWEHRYWWGGQLP